MHRKEVQKFKNFYLLYKNVFIYIARINKIGAKFMYIALKDLEDLED